MSVRFVLPRPLAPPALPGRCRGRRVTRVTAVEVRAEAKAVAPTPRSQSHACAHLLSTQGDREQLYETLGVAPGASAEAVKRAYRRLALRCDGTACAHQPFTRPCSDAPAARAAGTQT